MLPVSEEFLATLRGSHQVVTSVYLVTPGQTGVTPTGRELAVVEGAVTLDGTADVRGTLDLTVAEPWPDGVGVDQLAPYGSEVFVTRGVVLGNGKIQRAPLGYYRLTMVEQSDAPQGTLRLTGQDRMAGIVDARLLSPVQYSAATTYGQAVEDLVTGVYPGATIDWDDATDAQPLGRAVVSEDDRYALLLDLVQSAGKIMFWDYRGVLVVKDPPDAAAPVWEVNAGRDGVLVSVGRALSREEVYNAVAATGEALDDSPPVAGYAYDLDPASPTYWDGPFGKVPRFYSSPLLTTADQATKAAESLLAQSTGLPYVVDFSAVPNPALEPFDPVRVTYPVDMTRHPRRAREIHVLAAITIPLGAAGTLDAHTRKVTL